MKPSSKIIMASGYVIVAGLVLSLTGYVPSEIIGNMICGAGFVLLIQGLHELVWEARENPPDSE